MSPVSSTTLTSQRWIMRPDESELGVTKAIQHHDQLGLKNSTDGPEYNFHYIERECFFLLFSFKWLRFKSFFFLFVTWGRLFVSNSVNTFCNTRTVSDKLKNTKIFKFWKPFMHTQEFLVTAVISVVSQHQTCCLCSWNCLFEALLTDSDGGEEN